MINQYEVPSLLRRLLPTGKMAFSVCHIQLDIYKDIQLFTDYTKEAIREHHYPLAKRCFRMAEKMYEEGDAIVKNAIENIFVYSFSSFLPDTGIERLMIKSFIPVRLYALYVRQVNYGSC